ncbi:MAG TPA: site-specific integrase, partial [Allosphingosinicella sp.]
VICWDTELTGFGLKVTPKGKRNFFVYYRTAKHEQRRPIIGSYPALRPEAARTIAQDWLAEARAGGDPSLTRQLGRVTSGEGTVRQLFDAYKRAKASLKSLGEIERIFEKDILPTLGEKRAEEVRRGDVSRLLDRLASRSPTAASNARKRLSAFYSWALPRLPDGAVNPVQGSVAAPPPAARARVLMQAEVKALWDVLGNEREPWRSGLRLLILTGQRRGEVFAADWSEFNLGDMLWTIPAARAKNGKAHLVPLSAETVEVLTALAGSEALPRSGSLFPSAGDRPFSRAARRIRNALSSELGSELEPWSWHDIRRTVATGMQRLGVRLEVTEAVLNHVSGSRSGIVGVYQRYEWLDEKRAALAAWAADVRGRAGASNVIQLRA